MANEPDNVSDRTIVTPESESPSTSSPPPSKAPRLHNNARPVNSSTETLDLALDLDLDRQLQGEDEDVEAFRTEGSGESKLEGPSSPIPPHPVGPATLAHDDPENPRNWSTRKKILCNVAICTWVLSLTYSSTAYIASISSLEVDFSISQEVAIVGVTFMVLGFSAGPLLFGPSSELFGRRTVYIFCAVLYSAVSFGGAFSTTATQELVFRFFMGFFGAASINNVPASIGDFTIPANRNQYTILYAAFAFGGPAFGPLCSSFIQTYAGTSWNLRVMAIFNTLTSIGVIFVPETHGPTLLKWRVKREGNAPPPLSLKKIAGVYKIALSRPLIYLFTEPTVMLISVYLSTLYGLLYGFFEAFEVVYVEERGFSQTSYGLTYIGLGLGFLFATVVLATAGSRYYAHYDKIAKSKGLKPQPEARLGLAFVGSVIAPISLFFFAWTAPFTSIHWIAPVIAEGMFAFSMLLIFTAFIPYLIDVYTTTAASALAAGMASRALIGSIFPLFSLQMYHALSVQGATSLLAGLALILAPIPFVFNRYGPAMRQRSRYVVMH